MKNVYPELRLVGKGLMIILTIDSLSPVVFLTGMIVHLLRSSWVVCALTHWGSRMEELLDCIPVMDKQGTRYRILILCMICIVCLTFCRHGLLTEQRNQFRITIFVFKQEENR